MHRPSQEANLPLYVEYCKMVFKHFGPRIQLWATMNEPTVSWLAEAFAVLALLPPVKEQVATVYFYANVSITCSYHTSFSFFCLS